MFLVIVPVGIPFFESFGLSMKEIFFIQSMFGLSLAIFEVPSAYMGDLLGRKSLLVCGGLICGIAFSLLLFVQGFWSFLFYEIFLAIGYSFISGADLSILYDSIAEDRNHKISAMGNYHALQLIGESTAAILCAALIWGGFKYIVFAQVIVGWIPFFIALTLTEPRIERMERGKHFENIYEVLRFLNDDKNLVRSIFWNMTLWSVCTFCAIWILQKLWTELDLDLWGLSLFWAFCNLSAAAMGKWAPRLEVRFGARKTVVIMMVLPVMAYLVMGVSSGPYTCILGVLFYYARGINFGVLKEAFNHRLPAKFRNTANSMTSLTFRLGFFILGPIIGFIIDEYGVSKALIILGVFFASMGIFYTRLMLRRL